VLVGTYGLDQHETGAQLVAQVLRDAGAEVIYLGRFNLPERIAAVAIDEDADVIGMSCHSWEYLQYTRELLALLRTAGNEIPIVLGGAVITAQDARELEADGVAAIFGPSATPDRIIERISELVDQR
jgi:methylmalonyl-CoA mutase C-terminal domain/subunit